MRAKFVNGGESILIEPQTDAERQLCERFVDRLHAKKRNRLHLHNYGWDCGPAGSNFDSMLVGIIKWPKKRKP